MLMARLGLPLSVFTHHSRVRWDWKAPGACLTAGGRGRAGQAGGVLRGSPLSGQETLWLQAGFACVHHAALLVGWCCCCSPARAPPLYTSAHTTLPPAAPKRPACQLTFAL